MNMNLLRISAMAMVAGSTLFGQNLTGTWQGSLAGPDVVRRYAL